MKTLQLTAFGQRATFGLWLVTHVWLGGCGGGGSAGEGWDVDSQDSGATTSTQKSERSTDKAQGGAGGTKSATAENKAGSGSPDKGGAGGSMSAVGGKGGSDSAKSGTTKSSGGKGGTAAANGGAGGSGGRSSDAMGGGDAILSAACKACWTNKSTMMIDTVPTCDSFGTMRAMAGPKAGLEKKALCEDLLRCVAKTRCEFPTAPPLSLERGETADPTSCLCAASPDVCQMPTAPVDGPCGMEALAAAEAKEYAVALGFLTDPNFAAGIAMSGAAQVSYTCAKTCGLCDATDSKCVDVVFDGAGGDPSMLDGGI